jgi:hypothetical protein
VITEYRERKPRNRVTIESATYEKLDPRTAPASAFDGYETYLFKLSQRPPFGIGRNAPLAGDKV